MSKISQQADALRKTADKAANLDDFEHVSVPWMRNKLAPMLREAADTIISLRDRLQRAEEDARIIEIETSHIDIKQGEVITRFVPAELDCIEDKSRWFELFGTPERAANVILALQICPCVKDECASCPACDVCFEHYKGGRTVYEMAEWLRGDA